MEQNPTPQPASEQTAASDTGSVAGEFPARLREMAPDPVLYLSGLALICGVAAELAFFLWMW